MSKTLIQDGVLIKRYLQGNQAAFETLVQRHKMRIFTSVLAVVNDHYLAEDIFQETFIKIIKSVKSGKYNHEDKFLPWALRIARNLAIDSIRSKKRMPNVVNSDGYDLFETLNMFEPSQEDQQVQKEETQLLHSWINELPIEQKEVLILRNYAELSFKEIAAITETNINTCIGRMHYAIINLRKMMEKSSIKIK
ncbi:MAG: RNA polymerase sigma factor [Bacteroidia bacterium]|jgi:RNA polymerase sigma-70 factor (ECF subfamily)